MFNGRLVQKISLAFVAAVLCACTAREDDAPPPVGPQNFVVNYSWIGNVDLAADAAHGLVAGAVDGFTLVPQTAVTTTAGGVVTVLADGAFNYSAPHLFTGTDTFTCVRADNGGVGTVTISMLSRAWFVDADALISGDGTINEPFDILAAAEAASLPGDTIVVRNATPAVIGSIALKANQTLIGEGVAFERAGITIIPAGTKSGITSAGVAITAAAGCSIRGLELLVGTTTGLLIDLPAPGGSVSVDSVAFSANTIAGVSAACDTGTALTLALTNCQFTDCNDGVSMATVGASTVTLGNTSFLNNIGTDVSAAWIGNSSSSLAITACTFPSGTLGALTATAADAAAVNVTFDDCPLIGGPGMSPISCSAAGTSQLVLMVQDSGLDTMLFEGADALVRCDAVGSATLTTIIVGCTLAAQSSTGVILTSSSGALAASWLDNCTFTGMQTGVFAAAGGAWNATIHNCSFTQLQAAVILARQSGNHGLIIDGCTMTGIAGNSVLVTGLGGHMALGLLNTTVTGSGAALAFLDQSSTSALTVSGCTLVNNGPIALNAIHSTGAACVNISGTTYGRNDGFPSVLMLQNNNSVGVSMTLSPPTTPNTAMPGSQIFAIGNVVNGPCGN